MIRRQVINVGHLCCGVGAGARGFQKGSARVRDVQAVGRCLGGVDSDPGAIAAFERKTGVKGTVMDLFSREQYRDFHGHEPPASWREATPDGLRRAFQNEHPHILFMSMPCKGNSGLLAETKAKTAKYQALNGLALRGVMLALEAYKDDPVELIIFENVPRISIRSRRLLDQIGALLHAYGYAYAETEHCCGEIGGLAQRRRRFLLVARHMAKVGAFLYQPRIKKLQTVGSVLSRLPLPGDPAGGAMHRMPALQWKTWVRLALVEAGSDWRSLNRLNVRDGFLTDLRILPERPMFNEALGVLRWQEPSGTVTSRGLPLNGRFSVADPRTPDPRVAGHPKSVQLGVRPWDATAATVTGQYNPGQGPFAVADPRSKYAGDYKQTKYRVSAYDEQAGAVIAASTTGNGAYAVADPRGVGPAKFNNTFRVVSAQETSPAVTGGTGPSAGGLAVADPRPGYGPSTHHNVLHVCDIDDQAKTISGANHPAGGAGSVADPRLTNWNPNAHRNKLRVEEWEAENGTGCVTGSRAPYSGGLSIADPRPVALSDAERDAYLSGGHYGVNSWGETTRAVPAAAKNNNGPWSVGDPRGACYADQAPVILPLQDERLVAVIRALDGTWHRPFTTLELAALQSMVDLDKPAGFWLPGKSDSQWREWIGNAVPEDAARGMASTMYRTLLLNWAGDTGYIDGEDIWVKPVAIGLSLAQGPTEIPA